MVTRSIAVRKLAPSVLINGLAPLLAYLLLRPQVSGDAVALAIGGAIPVLVTLAEFLYRRRVDPIGVVAVIGFGIALGAAILSGGNSLVLKLHDSIITGPLGLLFLASLVTRRPLLLVIKELAERGKQSPTPANSRAMYVLTGILGTVMVIHAAVILLLALALPTATFLAVGRPVGWAVMAAGIGALLWSRNRFRTSARPVA